MPPPHLPTLILDALLRPARFAAFVAGGPGAGRWAGLAAVEVLGVTAGLIAALGLFIPIGPVGLIAGPGLTLALTLLAALPPFFSLPVDYPTGSRLTFSFARTLISFAPSATMGLTLIFSSAFPDLQHSPLVILLVTLLLGIWLGGTLTVALLVSPQRSTPPTLRWVGVIGSFLVSTLIWYSEPLHQTEAILFTPLLIGLGLGLLRPLSYLWEAPLSIGLALAVRLGVPAHRLLALHPVSLDELCLIPMPGLSALLTYICTTDITIGGSWLVQVAAHTGQAGAARRALDRLMRSGQAHPVLFWLSTDAEGAAWLLRLCATVPHPHPLIVTYAALAAVSDPAAWPSAIGRHRKAITDAASRPGGSAMQALLETGAQVLLADRWSTAMLALRAASIPQGVAPDPLWHALETVRTWSDSRLPALIHDRAHALAALWETTDTLDGWPAALLNAVAEHLVFLLIVEQRRGVWLV
ncbi:MAG: hypothetical protein WCK70_12950 [Chloroflexales bacterium]|jgi:hypothetical protein